MVVLPAKAYSRTNSETEKVKNERREERQHDIGSIEDANHAGSMYTNPPFSLSAHAAVESDSSRSLWS